MNVYVHNEIFACSSPWLSLGQGKSPSGADLLCIRTVLHHLRGAGPVSSLIIYRRRFGRVSAPQFISVISP
jgi:hypothetical protein